MAEKSKTSDLNETGESIDPEIQKRIDKGLHLPKQVADNPEFYHVDDDIRGVHYSLKLKYTQYLTNLKNPLGFLKSDKK